MKAGTVSFSKRMDAYHKVVQRMDAYRNAKDGCIAVFPGNTVFPETKLYIRDQVQHFVVCKYRVSQKKRGAFVGLWRRIEPLDHRQLNFFMQPTV